jgi:hypothetical protein
MSDEGHFFGDYALARVVHLRKVAVCIFLLAPGKPLGSGLGDAITVAAIAIGGRHDQTSL